MGSLFQSLLTLAVSFGAIVAATLALATMIIPSGTDGRPTDATSGQSPVAEATAGAGPITEVGGLLTVTGDREGSLRLTRETTDGRYGLVGNDGRVLFEGQPLRVARIQYDGLEFFIDPDDCTVEPGERHDPTGVAGAEIRCEEVEDVRGNGVFTFEGTVGMAADLLGLRGELPESGGTAELGDETLTFDEVRIVLQRFGGTGLFAGQLYDEEQGAGLTLTYDGQTHELSVAEIQYGGDVTRVPDGACPIAERELGLLNPHTRVVELMIRCQSVEVPELGSVPLEGRIVAELAEPPR